MRRREFVQLTAGTALMVPFLARAQQAPRLARIGYLGIASGPLADQFLAGMRENGYVEGQNLSVERREYAGNIPRLAEFAAELVRLKVDVIFATGPGPVRAVANATRDIPLVAIDLKSDPVEAGWVTSLARPGGNITGVFLDLPELIGKWLEFARELIPKLSRVAALWDPETGGAQVRAARAAARSLGVALEILAPPQALRALQGDAAAAHRGDGRRPHDAEHVGSRCLLRQRLARLGDQSRVFHRDHCLRGEIPDERDLFTGEGPNLGPVKNEQPAQHVVLAQGDPQRGPSAPGIGEQQPRPNARAVILGVDDVSDVDEVFAVRHGGQRTSGALRPYRRTGGIHERRREVALRGASIELAVIGE